MSLKKQAVSIYEQTLDVVKPASALAAHLQWNPDTETLTIGEQKFQINSTYPLYVIGFGKAAAEMAKAVEQIFGNAIVDGMVITTPENVQKLQKIQVFKGSHPLPDRESLSSSYELRDFAKSIPQEAMVLNLVSGGTSSLFCLPADPLEIEDIHYLYKLLVQSGANIHEINTVRKLFSQVKGGQLLQSLSHTTLIDLIISDVPDDDLKVVGSGPTIPQKISAKDSFGVLKKYRLYDVIPHDLRRFLAAQMDKELVQKDIRQTEDFVNHRSFIIASATRMARHCADILQSEGFDTTITDEVWTGTVDDFEKKIMDDINKVLDQEKDGPTALIYYGECTIKVDGDGLGGRNQELALRMAKNLAGFDRQIVFLSAGTDGIDGPTDAAGAVVDQTTIEHATVKKMDADKYLANNDSYHFFDAFGGHIKPGSTGNNLMDLQIVLIP